MTGVTLPYRMAYAQEDCATLVVKTHTGKTVEETTAPRMHLCDAPEC